MTRLKPLKANKLHPNPQRYAIDVSQTQFISSEKEYFSSSQLDNHLSQLGLSVNALWGKNKNRFQLEGKAFYSANEEEIYLTLPNLNYQFHFRTLNSSLYLGRKQWQWSRAEDLWQEGSWEPRFGWDPLDQHFEGLSGAFYQWQNSLVSFRAFYSSFYVPETTPKFSVDNGKIRSNSPWFPTMPEKIRIFGVENNVNYKLNTPEISEIVAQRSVGTHIQVKKNNFFVSSAWADKPMNSIFVRLPYQQNINQTIDVTINPVVLRHQISSLELGYQDSTWEFWINQTDDQPQMDAPDYRWISQWAQSSRQTTTLAGYTFKNQSQLYMSYHHVMGAIVPDVGENAQVEGSLFSSRFRFLNSYKLGVQNLKPLKEYNMLLKLESTYDNTQRAGFFSSSARWKLLKNTEIQFQLNFLGLIDEDPVENENGFLRAFRSNDNLTVKVKHVF